MHFLKQSPGSNTTVQLGPFVDATDGKTPETSLTIASTDVQLSKNGASFASKNESTGLTGTGDTFGYYDCLLDSGTDLATVGRLRVHVNVAGALPVWQDFMVLPANTYDSLVGGSDKLQVDTVELNSVAASAANLERSASTIVRGTSDNTGFTATTTIFESDDVTEATSDHYKGRVVVFTNNALAGQASAITAYSLSSGRGRFTINALTEIVPDDTTFVIV